MYYIHVKYIVRKKPLRSMVIIIYLCKSWALSRISFQNSEPKESYLYQVSLKPKTQKEVFPFPFSCETAVWDVLCMMCWWWWVRKMMMWWEEENKQIITQVLNIQLDENENYYMWINLKESNYGNEMRNS